ncbi:MAG: purine-nucleoside phosphorylase [Flavobacteriales bacterium]|nr:purine-nucleoside phosphorylase [Flavobacteriales bacterium]MCW8913073.1 purine-nucleoside phosphorylase [Flavobacteriales bacterium]MCW8938416.1 purine-nucleoside phosphorylase [Flavobacteriales bacterium]MCW8939903.1 purine-nucleoside phosphorylase [Flavobacteriales bacterium]MCW8968396.1 purine-nucleoside phosphorylase [Flavobacteriales bacterium]
MLEKIQQTKAFLATKTQLNPKVGIVLGTGLGNLSTEIKIETAIPYEEIPNFPVSTVEGHSGKLLFGTLNGIPVVAMQGRFHYYEGYSLQECTFPIRVMKALGIEQLFLSNASGGVNANFEVGDIMLITDHINLLPDNPLRGKNISELGPRFPDMSEPYSKKLITEVKQIAKDNNIKIQEGVYAALSGPTFETPAEYKFIQIIGADTVGMSTVPEVIVARHMDIPCMALSIITDLGVDGKIIEISHEEVQQVAKAAEPKMTLIIKELLAKLHN